MEHEAFVPVPTEPLRQALGDPVRVARAIPGLQRDVADEGVGGRLKVRIAGHTITYRGSLRLARQSSREYAIEGDATEARGTGVVKLALTLRLSATDDGTTLTFTGTATADGRAAELDPGAVDSAARRLLNRCATGLAAEAARGAADGDGDGGGAGASAPGAGAGIAEAVEEVYDPVGEDDADGVRDMDDADDADDADGADGLGDDDVASVFDTDVPPPSLARYDADDEDADDMDADDMRGMGEDLAALSPPAEAAHARRTMIGRSAEEVDHAPPRGRYAPVPAPATTVSASDALRWAAPAAALVVASAIVAGRVLRRRK
ncbi:SRPBCC domain-containing protein [Streptomyces sp. O3]